ncbi:MAG: SsrA-binding protein SmpB [Candidatus Marinimicrobia bacterium]|jgi:SsrA-binding protein|nr:SsrA-binding protein SmpB [Candidatus Neomarinimicrobiota bacterium]MBT4360429.1 SsrA-binding protein SmpB [Candidatus Neomarinimicrobiota bacterium]MBT4715516.1 SsrA-binding protein SmpB [Candidatus Neomarinimicrobiota bacterium]MBT4947286.1 SsrA-binding protein SmpB [Candidatus Neomarinimicrobiota bacterium]MBT5270736.1 SsrA-binding protein SmpB [Candidatus Neomarinimicrobiota bacterium]
MNDDKHIKLVLRNKRAYYEYEIVEKFEAGISLHGTEVKSIRAGKLNMGDSYARPRNGSISLLNLHISPWETANDYDQHDPTRPRLLLLHKKEIRKLTHEIEAKGYTLLPLSLYFKAGKLKVELGLAKGKNVHDKRQTSLKRDAKREMERARKLSH